MKVIAGRDKGKTGRVISVDRRRGKVLVEGVSMIKRHTQPNPAKQIKGGIAEKESPIAISNVMVLTSGGVPTRIGYRMEGAGAPSIACASPRRAARFWTRGRKRIEMAEPKNRNSPRSQEGSFQEGRRKAQAAARRRKLARARSRSSQSREAVQKVRCPAEAHYKDRVVPALVKEFGYKNVMAVPKIDKVSVNIGLGEATQNAKLMDGAVNELGADRRPEAGDHQSQEIHRRVQAARRMSIGTMVTLRGDRMYEFLDRLMNVALPRVRDFRGVSSKSFDGRGNYTLGIKRPADFSRDRLQQGGKGQRDEHFHHHHGEDRRRRAGAVEAHGNAVPRSRAQ